MVLEQSVTGRPRARAKAHVKATRPPICAMCGYQIHMDANPYRDPMACTVDEWLPRHLGGSAIDPANLRLMHRHCNGSKGKRWPVTDEMRERCRTHIARLLNTTEPALRPW